MNSEVIELDLDPDTYDYLQKIAKASGQTLDAVVCVILALEIMKRRDYESKLD